MSLLNVKIGGKMSLLKFEALKNVDMKRIVPINGVKIVDKNGYIGEDITEYFPHQQNMNYVNYALTLNGPNYSKIGLGQVEFIDSDYLVNIGGRDYRTCTIGGMVWLAENLDYKFEVSGSQISLNPNGTPNTPAAWYYDRDELNYGIDGTYKCGLLYNWHAVKYLNDNRASLIPGWHVATHQEWTNLATEIGGESTAGTKLKAKNNTVTSNWPSNWSGTDDFEFNALPSGRCVGSFNSLGSCSYFWTSTEYNGINAYSRYLGTGASLKSDYYDKPYGYSVRLVKDA
jgi:uncharacterized protein (TIGR02145 family)